MTPGPEVIKLEYSLRLKIMRNDWPRCQFTRVGISRTTAKSRQRKFVPSSHPGPFAVVKTSLKSQTKVGTLTCFDLL